MFRTFIASLLLACSVFSFAEEGRLVSESELSAEEQQYVERVRSLLDSLQYKEGKIALAEADATLNIPSNFYFLDAKDSQTVLVDLWGNPPGQSILGMIFPAEGSPMDSDSWAVTISYEEDGYVSDENAADIDYNELLQQMKDDTAEGSKAREKAGYGTVELIGWAAQPFYDASTNKLHWAKEVKFDNAPDNTLNYNVRVLGRKGVLILDFIAGIEQLPKIKENLNDVLALAEFDQGSTYSEFNPELDKVAAYGIGALVAGKVLAKTGLIAAAIIFFKKFGVFIILGLIGLIKALSSRKKSA